MRTISKIALVTAVILMIGCGKTDEDVIIIRASDLESNPKDENSRSTGESIDVPPGNGEEIVIEDKPEEIMSEVEVHLPDTVEIVEMSPEIPEGPRNRLAIEVNGSIYGSLSGLLENSDVLGAHIVRCMWWDTNPWDGMSAGDSIIVLFDADYTTRENQVVALKYIPHTGTQNHPFSIYVFHKTGDNYPSFYYADGMESTMLLDNLPIATFEEITGVFGERRAGGRIHAGVDFKAPAGTPVWTAHGGVVTRVNWNYAYNGNCVEVDIGNGHKEIFLHMQNVAPGIVPGVILRRGDVVGSVGNTGRTSTAAHLHY
ncbi:MAG: M23 family metallopeptidase [FCB group bacterium]|nr:M23 family metallopeptidase [FCB group bacterium]